MSTLLAHLYSRIKGSPEDVATMSLCYILENSNYASRAFEKYISAAAHIHNFPQLTYQTQSVGEEQERPDLTGIDEDSNELFLCEAKFWAGLTKNQPLGYLNRLRKGDHLEKKALVFICPNARKISLWGELLRICGVDNTEDNYTEEFHINIDGIAMAIVSWQEIITILKQVLNNQQSPLLGDLLQLEGLCKRMDESAFIPFKEEDLGIDRAKTISSLYTIVDKVAELVFATAGEKIKKLNRTSIPGNYLRYFETKEIGCAVQFSCEYWATKAETPFWFYIRDIVEGTKGDKWGYPHQAKKKLAQYENKLFDKFFVDEKNKCIVIPLYPKLHQYEDEVVNGLYQDVMQILSLFY